MSARGRRVTFHGAYTTKADAVRKERRVGGFIQPRMIRGRRRYVVMTENPGFFSHVWKGAKSGYHSYRASRYEEKAKRHRTLVANPRAIPGTVMQIRYRRPGAMRGLYKHDFKPGVRMVANADGSVTLRGPRKIHAVDSEPGFWQKYGHERGRGMRNARRRRASSGGMDTTTMLLLAVGGYLAYTYFSRPAFAAGLSPATAEALAAQRAGERAPGFYDPLAAWRLGEQTAGAVIDPMAGAEEVPVDWSVMPSWDWGA